MGNHYYDCSFYLQEDTYVTKNKDICEHVGRTYQHDGDIMATIDIMVISKIPLPVDSSSALTSTFTLMEREKVPYINQKIFHHKINKYVRQKATLDVNMQQEYSLILGQCTDLIKNKLLSSKNGMILRHHRIP